MRLQASLWSYYPSDGYALTLHVLLFDYLYAKHSLPASTGTLKTDVSIRPPSREPAGIQSDRIRVMDDCVCVGVLA